MKSTFPYYNFNELDASKMQLELAHTGKSHYFSIIYNNQIVIAFFEYEQHAKDFLKMLQEKGNKK